MSANARRLTIPLVALLVATGMVFPVRGQTIVAGPTTAELTAAAGERITVPIAIDMTGAPGVNLGAYRIRFSWNPTGLSFVSASGGTFGSPVFNSDSVANGELRFAAASAAGGNGIFTLANVTFQVTATVSGTFSVVFEELTAAGTFQNLIPYLIVTQGSFCGSDVWGDMDGNGQVQSVDAQIVLMHSVGLPVADTTRGDVDPDGVVDPRDALVILSYVVGLDVTAFRVGQPISASCTPGAPDAVRILPATLSLAPGDAFRVTAEVEDSNGVLLGGKNLAWSSNDGAVATVDSLGVVTAVGAGTATISAAVSPGITGSATVTVGARHRWVVNPVVAQGQPSEVGSDTYPFSTIAAAVAAAGDGDTIFIHVATYNEPLDASGFNGIVFLGDSGAAGMPIIARPNQSAGVISGSGKVTLRRLIVEESATGLVVSADSLAVESVVIRAIRGLGLSTTLAGAARIRGVTVSGVQDYGITVSNATRVLIANAIVSGVESGQAAYPAGISLTADSIVVDSSEVRAVQGIGVWIPSMRSMRLSHSTVSDVQAEGVHIDGGVTLDVGDSVLVERARGSAAFAMVIDTLRANDVRVRDCSGYGFSLVGSPYDLALFTGITLERVGWGLYGAGGVRASVVNSTISGVSEEGLWLRADTLLVDQSLFEQTGSVAIETSGADYARVVNSTLRDVGSGIWSDYGYGYVEVTGTTIRGVRGFGTAIDVDVDSLVMVHDTIVGVSQYGGVGFYGEALRVRDSRVSNTGWEGIYVNYAETVEIVGVTVDSAAQGADLGYYNAAIEVWNTTRARLDSNVVRWSRWQGISVDADTAHVEGNLLQSNVLGSGTPSGWGSDYYTTVSSESRASVIRGNSFVDNWGGAFSVSYFDTAVFDSNTVRGGWHGVYAYGTDTLGTHVEVRDNTFRGILGETETYLVYGQGLGQFVVEDNIIDSVAGSAFYAYSYDSVSVARNAISTRNDYYGASVAAYGGRVPVISGNSIECFEPLQYSTPGIDVTYSSPLITGNTIRHCYTGISVYSYVNDDVATVLDNRVIGDSAGTRNYGIRLENLNRAVVRNNLVTGSDFWMAAIYVAGYSSGHIGYAEVIGDTVSVAGNRGIVVSYADTAVVDRNVVTGMVPGRAIAVAEKSAVQVTNIYDSTAVMRNTVIGNSVRGMLFTNTVQHLRVDTNLVTDNLDTGIVFQQSAITGDTIRGRFNTVRRNRVGIKAYVADVYLDSNNIEGNGVGVYNDDADTVYVVNNWWGDPAGPRCSLLNGAGGNLCDPAAVGDSLTGWASATYVLSPVATDTIAAAPVGAPMALPLVSASPSLSPAIMPAGSSVVPPEGESERLAKPEPLPPGSPPVGATGTGGGSRDKRGRR